MGAGRNFEDHRMKTALATTAVVVGFAAFAALVYVEVKGL
jgi:hypothetical protein